MVYLSKRKTVCGNKVAEQKIFFFMLKPIVRINDQQQTVTSCED